MIFGLVVAVLVILGSLFLPPQVSIRKLDWLNQKLAEEFPSLPSGLDGIFVVENRLAVLERGVLFVMNLNGTGVRKVASVFGEGDSITLQRGSSGGVVLPNGKLMLLMGGESSYWESLGTGGMGYSSSPRYFEGIELVDLERASSKWVQFADKTKLGLSPQGVVLRSGKVFVVGQRTTGQVAYQKTYLLDPNENNFFRQQGEIKGVEFFTRLEKGPELRIERQRVELFALSDGRVLIGGADRSGRAAELEIFDPKTGSIGLLPHSPQFSYPIFVALNHTKVLVADLRETSEPPAIISLPKLKIESFLTLSPQLFGEDLLTRLKQEREDPQSPLYWQRNLLPGSSGVQPTLNLGPLLALYGWAYVEAGPNEFARLLITRHPETGAAAEYKEFIRQVKAREEEGKLNRWVRFGLALSQRKLSPLKLYFGQEMAASAGAYAYLTSFNRAKVVSYPGYASYILASVEGTSSHQVGRTTLSLLTLRSYASFTRGFLILYFWAQFWKLVGGFIIVFLMGVLKRRKVR